MAQSPKAKHHFNDKIDFCEKKNCCFCCFGFFFFNSFSFVEARGGCFSHYGGVCGCFCCDGAPLLSTCLPYYPQCLNNNKQTQEKIYIPKYQIQPTNTPIILPTNTPIPTHTFSKTPILTPTLTQTPTF